MRMRFPKVIIILIVLSLCFGVALAGAILNSFTAQSSNGDVIVKWTTGEERDLARFEVQRRAGLQGDYVTVGTVEPKGSNSDYQFIDRSAYKTTDTIYKYRLAIVSRDGSVGYSQEVTVSHGVSGVKRTWGSIKAMFR